MCMCVCEGYICTFKLYTRVLTISILILVCSHVCAYVAGRDRLIGCQGSAHRRACGQLQSAHLGSVMRLSENRSHDDFGRAASLLQVTG